LPEAAAQLARIIDCIARVVHCENFNST
jgi:hypothetical protein